MKTFKTDSTLRLNLPCPYCGGKLTASANAWEQEDDGTWFATELDINCDTEPDIDGDEWQGWWDDHSHDHCGKWHDLHERVVRGLRKCARFDMADSLSA